MGLKVSTTCELTLRRATASRRRHPARRRARRHRADVPDHRVRADDGRHQGDRHAVHRLPQRAGLRQAARAGRRPDPDDRQGRAAGHDHAPPRRPPLADAPEGVRRGAARAGALHRDAAGRASTRRSSRRHRGAAEDAPAAMADRVNDLLLPIVKGVGSERSWVLLGTERCRPSAAPASCRTTRSSSTSATPRSTRCTRARPRSRAWTSSSARSSATRARRSRTCPRRSRSSPRPVRAATALATERELLGKALEDVQGIVGFMVGALMTSDPRQQGGDVTNLYKVGQNTTPAAAGRRRPGRRLAAAAPGRGRHARRWSRHRPRVRDRAFYEGKVAAARFFARTVLPKLAAERADRRGDGQRADGRVRGRLLTRPVSPG